jgi:hypothetical protein
MFFIRFSATWGKFRVEVRVVGRDAHAVGADEAGRGLDLRLAALDGGPAEAQLIDSEHGFCALTMKT